MPMSPTKLVRQYKTKFQKPLELVYEGFFLGIS